MLPRMKNWSRWWCWRAIKASSAYIRVWPRCTKISRSLICGWVRKKT